MPDETPIKAEQKASESKGPKLTYAELIIGGNPK